MILHKFSFNFVKFTEKDRGKVQEAQNERNISDFFLPYGTPFSCEFFTITFMQDTSF